MPRLTIFAKGNSDVTESLFACRDADSIWNGMNEALRAKRPEWRVRMRHETLTRSDALLGATGVVPSDLRHVDVPAPFGMASQFSAAFYEPGADAYILSIQPDVTLRLIRHRATRRVFLAGDRRGWSAELRQWLRAECEEAPLLEPRQSLDNLEAIVQRLRQVSQAPILIYNLSSVTAGDTVDSYRHLPESLATRIKRFNLALIDLSTRTGVIVVDVDRIAARHGADRIKLDSTRLNCKGSRLIAEDVLRILSDHDCFAPPE